MQLAEIHFCGGNLRFAAGHFTIMSALVRERLHGHNYHLKAMIKAPMGEPGITFDYGIFRQKLAVLCQKIHSRFLLPLKSPFLQIEETAEHYRVTFAEKYMLFLKDDVMLLDMSNITIEELSRWFIDELLQDKEFIHQYGIQSIAIEVFNGHEHSAKSQWSAIEDL
jgi:6-pyruvoyltetrahydropterin/6-carboxytetrahydropterin synthase